VSPLAINFGLRWLPQPERSIGRTLEQS